MSRNPLGSEPHRFAVEELLDLYPVVRSPHSQAPVAGTAQRRLKSQTKRKKTATKPRKRPQATEASKRKKFE